MVVCIMLYCDQIAASESEAIEVAANLMRLDKKDVVVRSVTEVPTGVKVRVEAIRSRGQEALELLTTILKEIRVKCDLFYIESFENVLININGPHLGLIIGKGGSTLEALETLISAMHNRNCLIYKPVVINPGGYRENKEKALKSLVKRAVTAAETGEKISLPYMKQRDRKQVHQIVKDFPGFRSRSAGDGKDRRVFIYMASELEPSDEDIEMNFIPPEQTRHVEGSIEGQPSV
jgi:spoIIIJ-associated protein